MEEAKPTIEEGLEVYDHTSPRFLTLTGTAVTTSLILPHQLELEWLFKRYFADRHEEPPEVRNTTGGVDLVLVKQALTFIPADEYQTWIKVGMALHAGGLDVELWDEWSKKSEKYEPGVCAEKWRTFK